MPFQGTLKPMKTLTAQQPWAPPEWALLERRLFDMLNTSAVEYVQRYTREGELPLS